MPFKVRKRLHPVTQIISLGQKKTGIPHCWHKDFPPGPLAEIPFLKAKPELREGEDYVLIPDERDQESIPPNRGSDAEAP